VLGVCVERWGCGGIETHLVSTLGSRMRFFLVACLVFWRPGAGGLLAPPPAGLLPPTTRAFFPSSMARGVPCLADREGTTQKH
jgi:hypothetical protein